METNGDPRRDSARGIRLWIRYKIFMTEERFDVLEAVMGEVDDSRIGFVQFSEASHD